MTLYLNFNPIFICVIGVDINSLTNPQIYYDEEQELIFDCADCSNTTSLGETTTSKKLIQILDMMGRETSYKPNTPLIYVYDDGSIEKVFSVEY